jgi:hypothetical protein
MWRHRYRLPLLALALGTCAAEAVPLNIQTLVRAGQPPASVPVVVGPATLSFTPPAPGHSLSVVGRLGLKTNATWKLSMNSSAGTVASVSLVSKGGLPASTLEYLRISSPADTNALALTAAPEVYMSRSLTLPGPRKKDGSTMYFLKPNLSFYTNAERVVVGHRYPKFPSALTHVFTLRLENTARGMDLWLDGRYLGVVPAPTVLTAGSVVLMAGNELVHAYDWPALRSNAFLPLDLSPYARTGTTCRLLAEVSGLSTASVNTVSGAPFLYTQARDEIDVGLSRWLEESVNPAYCDNDTTRSSFNGCPESIILSVPTENHLGAHVLCVVEPSATKVPVLTLRVTRFGLNYSDSGGRCDEAFADTTAVLPANAGEPLPPNVVQVGTITAGGLTTGDPEQILPVYKVFLPFKMGTIPDLLGTEAPDFGKGNQYLDIELTKSIRLRGTRRKPSGPPSAVHVLALTLERCPVDVAVVSSGADNVFYAADNPAFTLRLANTRDDQSNPVTVNWAITDYLGRRTAYSQVVNVPGKTVDGGVAAITIPVNQPVLGYFDILFTVTENLTGRELWRQPSSFVLLPPDTRTADTRDSPFGVWWFNGVHGTCGKLDVVGNLLMKAGMRKICPYSIGQYTEGQLAAYKLSYSMLPWLRTEAQVGSYIAQNPNIPLGMIYHETGTSSDGSTPYAEILGKPRPILSEVAMTALTNEIAKGVARGQFYRANYPDLKLTVGNSHSGFTVQLIRYGFPTNLVDCFAMEGVGGYTLSESPPQDSALQEVWWVREMQRIYGCADIPVSSGYEYIGRPAQDGSGLTEAEQAELFVRDALHCLAYGYLSINLGGVDDYGDSYNGTIYGGGGLLRRTPLLTPKPVYAMCATMTAMLDGATFAGSLETGSRSLYALEFKRAADYVYPIWTLRGKRLLNVVVGGSAVSLTDGMGNTTTLVPAGGVVTFQASQAPVYLVTAAPIISAITPYAATFEERPIGARPDGPRTLVVASPCGMPAPAGTNVYNRHTLVNAAMPDDVVPVDAGARLQCTGWTLTVSSPSSGSGTNAVFLIDGETTNDVSVLTWEWERQFRLAPSAAGPGSIDVPAGWHTTGTVVTITAAIAPGAVFAGWTGDTDGASHPLGTSTVIQLVMDRPRTIVAVFGDGDPGVTPLGTPIAWLGRFGLTNPVADDTADVDHDGQTAAQEFVAGTDPTNTLSAFKVVAHGLAGGSNFIVFLGSPNFGSPAAPFRMHFRSNLLEGAWQLIDGGIPRSSSGTNTWWNREGAGGGQGFFRPEATR